MHRFAVVTLFAALTTASLHGVAEDAIGVAFMLDELEYVFDHDADPIAWSAAVAAGNSERQFWLVSEGGTTGVHWRNTKCTPMSPRFSAIASP